MKVPDNLTVPDDQSDQHFIVDSVRIIIRIDAQHKMIGSGNLCRLHRSSVHAGNHMKSIGSRFSLDIGFIPRKSLDFMLCNHDAQLIGYIGPDSVFLILQNIFAFQEKTFRGDFL